jgi:hypothetical protein
MPKRLLNKIKWRKVLKRVVQVNCKTIKNKIVEIVIDQYYTRKRTHHHNI